MELITVKSMELRVMSNKTKIILVSIVGVIVVFGIGALAGNLMHSNSNAGAKSTTSVSAKKSSKASSSSVKQYVEGKDYTIERTEVDGVTTSVVDGALLKLGLAMNQNNNLNNFMEGYTSIVGYHDTDSNLGGNTLLFELTRKDGSHAYMAYDLQYQDVEDGDSDAKYLSYDLQNGYAKQVWKISNLTSNN